MPKPFSIPQFPNWEKYTLADIAEPEVRDTIKCIAPLDDTILMFQRCTIHVSSAGNLIYLLYFHDAMRGPGGNRDLEWWSYTIIPYRRYTSLDELLKATHFEYHYMPKKFRSYPQCMTHFETLVKVNRL